MGLCVFDLILLIVQIKERKIIIDLDCGLIRSNVNCCF